MTNKTIKYIREALQGAHGTLEATMADVEEKHAHWQPAGTAHAVGATYAHAVISEDTIINTMLRKQTPLYLSSFADKTGLSKPMPNMDKNWEKEYPVWTKSVKIELPRLKEYAQAVYKMSDEFIASLVDADLDKPVDLSAFGMEQKTWGYILDRFIVGHVDNITGEIAVLKGLQGLKGYPF